MKRLWILLLVLVLLLPVSSWAAVANDGSGTAVVTGGTSPVTLSTFTVGSGANRCLIVGAYIGIVGPTGVSVTWNGTSLGSPEITYTSQPTMYVFKMIAPASGNHNLVLSWTGGGAGILAVAEFSGADQSTCVVSGDDATATGTSTTASVTITSATGDATVAFTGNSSQYYTAQTQTLIGNQNSGTVAFDATYALGGTSNTHSFTVPSVTWGVVGVHVKAASGGGGSTCGSRLLLMGVGC